MLCPARQTMVQGGGDNSNVTLLCPEFFAAHAVRAISGLSPEGEEHDILRDIQSGNHAGKQEDAVVKVAEELRRSKGESVRALEWSEHDGLLCFRDHIYVPNDPDLCRCITSQHHDTRVAGHTTSKWKSNTFYCRCHKGEVYIAQQSFTSVEVNGITRSGKLK
jgi:hypothetical protein